MGTAVVLVTMANIAAKASMPTVTQPVVLGADLGQGLEVEQLAIAGVRPPSGQTQSDASAVQQALTLIVGYIPTEIVVTYVAVVAAIDSGATGSLLGQWVAFWFFLALSPSLCWVLYATNLRTQGRVTPVSPKQWPRWQMVGSDDRLCRVGIHVAGDAIFRFLVVSACGRDRRVANGHHALRPLVPVASAEASQGLGIGVTNGACSHPPSGPSRARRTPGRMQPL